MLKHALPIVAIAAILAVLLNAQKRTREEFSLPVTSPTSGEQMFQAYCADCHSRDAKGNGSLAPFLKIAPPNLTTLSKHNHGKFPYNRVYQTIRGESGKSAHGSREMPIWGPVFRDMGKEKKGEAETRMKNLTTYIESLQVR